MQNDSNHEKQLTASQTSLKTSDHQAWQQIKHELTNIHKELTECINRGISPKSSKVQDIIHHFYTLRSGNFYDLSNMFYDAMAQTYAQNSEFKTFFDEYQSKFQPFMFEAMTHYASKNLPKESSSL